MGVCEGGGVLAPMRCMKRLVGLVVKASTSGAEDRSLTRNF